MSNLTLSLFTVSFIFFGREINYPIIQGEAGGEEVRNHICIKAYQKKEKSLQLIFFSWLWQLMCITITFYDKARGERKDNCLGDAAWDIITSVLLTQCHNFIVECHSNYQKLHRCYSNTTDIWTCHSRRRTYVITWAMTKLCLASLSASWFADWLTDRLRWFTVSLLAGYWCVRIEVVKCFTLRQICGFGTYKHKLPRL